MKEEQKEMLGQVLNLMRNMSGVDSGSVHSGLPEEISIPATTVEDMDRIEEQLNTNSSVFKGLVRSFNPVPLTKAF